MYFGFLQGFYLDFLADILPEADQVLSYGSFIESFWKKNKYYIKNKINITFLLRFKQ